MVRDSKLKTIYRIIFLSITAMFLNGEFYKYGLGLVFQPLLFMLYVVFITTLEDLIRRFSLDCRQVFLIGAVFGLFVEGVFTRSFYADPPYILGVNWIAVLIQIVYWGLVTLVLTFYIGNRLVPRLDSKPLLSKVGWMIVSLWWGSIFTIWALNVPPLRNPGAIPVAFLAVILLIALRLLAVRKSKVSVVTVNKSRLLDILISVHILTGLVVGIFLRQLMLPVWILAGLVMGLATSFFVFGRRRLAI